MLTSGFRSKRGISARSRARSTAVGRLFSAKAAYCDESRDQRVGLGNVSRSGFLSDGWLIPYPTDRHDFPFEREAH
jgi:hypothetical protein